MWQLRSEQASAGLWGGGEILGCLPASSGPGLLCWWSSLPSEAWEETISMSSPTLLSFLLFTVVFFKKNICYFIILVRNSSRGVLIFFFLPEGQLSFFWVRKRGCVSFLVWKWVQSSHLASLPTILGQLQDAFFSYQIAGLKLLKCCRSSLPEF